MFFFCSNFLRSAAQNFQQLSYANAEVAQVLIRPHVSGTAEPSIATTTVRTGFLNGIRNFFARNTPSTSSPVPSITTTTIAPSQTNDTHGTSNGVRLYSGPPGNRNQQFMAAVISPSPTPLQPVYVPTPAPRQNQLSSTTLPTAPPRAKRPDEDFPPLGAPRRPRPNPNPAVPPTAPTPIARNPSFITPTDGFRYAIDHIRIDFIYTITYHLIQI